MRNWRVLTAVAAVILAAIAGVLVYKVSDDAKKDAKRPFSFESVLVAAKPIPTSMSFASALDGKYIVRADRVHTDLPDGAVSGRATDAALNSTYKGQVASHAIVADQTIVSTDFVSQNQVASGLPAQLDLDNKSEKEHLEAVTVTLDDTHAVGGFLQPGDHVNVILTGDIKDVTQPKAAGRQDDVVHAPRPQGDRGRLDHIGGGRIGGGQWHDGDDGSCLGESFAHHVRGHASSG